MVVLQRSPPLDEVHQADQANQQQQGVFSTLHDAAFLCYLVRATGRAITPADRILLFCFANEFLRSHCRKIKKVCVTSW